MRFAWIAFALLAVTACSTHDVTLCWPACDDADHTAFVRCVADGHGACEAGNRRCCALQRECVGSLEDQTVRTNRTGCMVADEMFCEPECDATNQASYDVCLAMGNASCSPGDDLCCALSEPCLGELGDVWVEADGCCDDDADCADGEYCETMTGTCYATDLCGDHTVTGDEECDEGPEPLTDCTYGLMSCEVCSADCMHVAGTTTFCGDDTLDSFNGETCEPPGTATCDATCQRIVPATCRDTRMTPGETDVDCGGTDCLPCAPGLRCVGDGDCGLRNPLCTGTPFCEPAMRMCSVMDECDDFDACTSDFCETGVGCSSFPLDSDTDGDGPEDMGCGGDCDDFDPTSSSLNTVDAGCTTGEVGFAVDNDCDGLFDEDC